LPGGLFHEPIVSRADWTGEKMRMTMTRKDMIRKLVALSVDTALAESQRYWLSEVFEKGFVGYGNFSDGQLLREMQLRGLAAPDEVPDDDIDDMEGDPSFDALDHSLADLPAERREFE
jgi:hypothetical protein